MIRICKYLSKAEWFQLFVGLLFIVAGVWLQLKLPDYMADITRLVETPNSEMHDVWVAGGKMLAVALGAMLTTVAVGFITARVSASFTQRLRSMQFRRVESFGPEELNRFSTASLITRSTNDVTQIQMFLTMGLLMLVQAPIMAVWAIAKIAGKGVEWTAATGVSLVLVMGAVAIIMAMVMPKFRSMQALTDNINRVARENLTGLRVVRAYNAEDYQQGKFDKANRDLTETQLFTNRAMSVMMPLMNTVMNGLTLAVYWIGAYLIDAAGLMDKLTLFSNMVVFSSYAIQVIMSFLMMSMVFVLWPRADVSAKRILEVLDTEPHVTDGTRTEGAKNADGTPVRGRVEFRDVSFTYPDAREPMLEHVSFTAQPGQTVAFIGSTGSGKTTLVNLVPRFYDATGGQVLVDGVDVKDYTLQSLRDKIGYVPQQSVMFKGTVASNVAFGDKSQAGVLPAGESMADVEIADTSTPQGRAREKALLAESEHGTTLSEAQMEDVRQAVAVAKADEFVTRMDGTYEAPIAQGGTNVSGGQKQRLSIARAVWRRPEILVFDDSFSALDFRTDHDVREALAREAGDATKLIVAQRIGTIMDADRIIVLDQGRVVGQGTHKELLRDCEVYRQIAESQLSEAELAS
ncbi:ABC transporter ATP-binding protein [Bifidobacterium thermacidophilum]|uniref:ATP-binding and permease protein of ABC transporter system n=1 Tax=Bifidobacterium thermacidophilum subsp. thermacidophilum TaxID=79262 RepID=A0A087E2P3_9BIFI|nr:ABC transporter ATP-binding protein [Bifidobacterium thermacidophilum]KFJ02044.1 ATP-binding and permease protein of ABC transporter system [Bifidobacterium thermacidophilum subsp. thermacidophilum]